MNSYLKIFTIMLLACITSLVIFSANIYFIAVFLGIVLSIISLVKIESAIWLILINVFILSSFVKFYLPSIGTKIIWITDLVLLILFLRILFDLLRQKVDILKDKINLLILILFFLGIFSAIFNHEPRLPLLCGIRNYFKYIPLYFAMRYFGFKFDFIKKIFGFLIGISLINIPVSLFQLLKYHEFDSVGGVFSYGGSGELCVYQILIMGSILLLLKHRIVKRRILFFLSLFILAPIFINETKAIFIFLPIALIYIYREFIFSKFTHTIAIVFVTIIMLFSFSLVYSRIVKDFSFEETFSIKHLYDYLYKMPYFSNERSLNEASLNRLSSLEFAYKNISHNAFNLLFGVGPGNASFSQLANGVGDYYNKFFYLKIDLIFLSRLLWEYGIVGLALFFWLLSFLWKQAVFLQKIISDQHIQYFSDTFNLLTMFLILTGIYNLSFHLDPFGCIFWLLGGFLIRVARQGNA
jgi:hypothetical protein